MVTSTTCRFLLPSESIVLKRNGWLFYGSLSIVGVETKTQIIRSCRGVLPRHDFYAWQNKILFLKFEKFRIPKQTCFKTFVLLLQPSMKPFDHGTSMTMGGM